MHVLCKHFQRNYFYSLYSIFRAGPNPHTGSRNLTSSSISNEQATRGRNFSGGFSIHDDVFHFHLDGVPPYGEVLL